jgi:hypothetical protein
MNNTIFDLIDEEEPTGTIFDVAERVEDIRGEATKKSDIPWYKSYPSSLAKGVTKGLIEYGRAFGPTREPYDPEKTKKVLDELLPSGEGFVETALEKSGQIAPFVASGSPSLARLIGTSVASGTSGATAKELGFGEMGQALAELPAQIVPDLSRFIKAGASNKEIVDFARSKGLTEEQIAPLIQSRSKQAVLGKVAQKEGRAQKLLSDSKEAVGLVYKDLYTSDKAAQKVSERVFFDSIDSMDKKLSQLPEKVRSKVFSDYQDLVKSNGTAADFMNFHADLNAIGDKRLGILKEDISKAIQTVDKGLAKDFQMTNELYGRWAKISKTLKPSVFSQFVEGSQPYRFIGGLLTGNPYLLYETAGEVALKSGARELLLSPRFQNLSGKMIDAINKSKFSVAGSIWEVMKQEVYSKDKNLAKEMEDIDFIDLLEKMD